MFSIQENSQVFGKLSRQLFVSIQASCLFLSCSSTILTGVVQGCLRRGREKVESYKGLFVVYQEWHLLLPSMIQWPEGVTILIIKNPSSTLLLWNKTSFPSHGDKFTFYLTTEFSSKVRNLCWYTVVSILSQMWFHHYLPLYIRGGRCAGRGRWVIAMNIQKGGNRKPLHHYWSIAMFESHWEALHMPLIWDCSRCFN